MGTSPNSGTKQVTVTNELTCDADSANKGKRVAGGDFDDKFNVSVVGKVITVTRPGANDWGLDLSIQCRLKGTSSTFQMTQISKTIAKKIALLIAWGSRMWQDVVIIWCGHQMMTCRTQMWSSSSQLLLANVLGDLAMG